MKIITLYNSLTRRKQEFSPADGKVAKIYSCGPTVYSSPSIGNMRAYIFTDILKKTINLAGFDIMDVMNITDVGHLQSDADEGEDKVELSAKRQGLTPEEIAKKYTCEFSKNMQMLNIKEARIISPATKYIDKMIRHISDLEGLQYTYKTEDGVYYDAGAFPDYYKLSGKPSSGDKAGARVAIGYKKNPHDFALWKFKGEGALQKWESPWGVGCPGWHIECSAIARYHLGDTLDIHTGGIDHLPIHHTNEIAQTEALTKKPMSNFWMHNEFMTVDGTKMSKSLGNVFTIFDLVERGFDPLVFRYLVLGTHYRKIINFTFEALSSAAITYEKLVQTLARHKRGDEPFNNVQAFRDRFAASLFDDLNTPKALAVVWEALKLPPSRVIYNLVLEFDQVLSLSLAQKVLASEEKTQTQVPKEITDLAKRRVQAKQEKDWETADKIRNEIESLGYKIMDTKDGFKVLDDRVD